MILSIYQLPDDASKWGLYQAIGATDHRLSVHDTKEAASAEAIRFRARTEQDGGACEIRLYLDGRSPRDA